MISVNGKALKLDQLQADEGVGSGLQDIEL